MQFKSSVIIMHSIVYSIAAAHSVHALMLDEKVEYQKPEEEEITISRNLFHDDTPDETISQDFIIIPLGCHCGPAWWMRNINLRVFAFPFDWCIVPYKSLYRVIDNNFKDYFNKENLVPSSTPYWSTYLYDFYQRIYHTGVDGSSGAVLDKHFEILFNHDFPNHEPETIATHYDTQYKKYARRIKRFFDELKSGKHIYFLRMHDITKDETLELHHLIKSKFSTTSFTLLAIGSDPQEFSEDWNIPHIKNLYISRDDANEFPPSEIFWQKFLDDLLAGNFK
jgi:hypothetical protein